MITTDQLTIRSKVLNLLPDAKLAALTPWKHGELSRSQMIEHINWHWDISKANEVRRYLDRGLEVGFAGK